MIKKLRSRTEDNGLGFTVSLAVLSAFFLCGAVAGCITAASVDSASGQNLSGYIGNYVKEIDSMPEYGLLLKNTLINYFKYPVIVFFLGFTALGVFCVPAAVCVRGFFISFSVTSIIRLFGYKGMILALAMFGFSSLISVSCLMIISSFALCAAMCFFRIMLGKKKYISGGILPSGFFIVSGICGAVLLVSAALDAYITPGLITIAARAIL